MRSLRVFESFKNDASVFETTGGLHATARRLCEQLNVKFKEDNDERIQILRKLNNTLWKCNAKAMICHNS